MRRIKNIGQWYKYDPKEVVVYEGTSLREVMLEVNPVGPCAVYLVPFVNGKPVPKDRVLLAVSDKQEELCWVSDGNFGVVLEPTVEVWLRRDQTPVAVPADPESKSLTRFEKAGLYVDALGHALHQQAVLNRLASRMDQDRAPRPQEERNMARLEELTALVQQLKEKLQLSEAPPEPSGDA